MSRPRILCVDDEPNVLEGLRDLLRSHFSLITATSGAAALELVREQEPFHAVLSDMRMPEMDGAQLLTHVRRISPFTVRLLLSGQTDIESAMTAVNHGQIFRFLLKPCPPAELIGALDAAVEQHRLVTSERVLLEETLAGAVHALTDVLALGSPKAFGRAARLKSHVSAVAAELGLVDVWELELAATLSQIGCMTLPIETAERYAAGGPLTDAEAVLIERLPQIAARILRHIPRLEGVHAVLAAQNEPAFAKGGVASELPLGARILRIAHDCDVLESRGLTVESAVDTLRGRQLDYDPELLELFARLRGAAVRQVVVRELPLGEVLPGMIFTDAVLALNGALLVARGHIVTIALLEKIGHLPGELRHRRVRLSTPVDAAAGDAGDAVAA